MTLDLQLFVLRLTCAVSSSGFVVFDGLAAMCMPFAFRVAIILSSHCHVLFIASRLAQSDMGLCGSAHDKVRLKHCCSFVDLSFLSSCVSALQHKHTTHKTHAKHAQHTDANATRPQRAAGLSSMSQDARAQQKTDNHRWRRRKRESVSSRVFQLSFVPKELGRRRNRRF